MYVKSVIKEGVSYFIMLGAVLATSALAPTPAASEPIIGLSAFGINSRNFRGAPCQRFLSMLEAAKTPAISVLYGTFGYETECLTQFWNQSAALGKRHITQIHFSNEAGRRSGLMDRADFMRARNIWAYNRALERMPKKLENKLRQRTRKIVELVAPFRFTGQFILSTGLEDNYTSKAWEKLYNVIRQEWPYEIGRNPVGHNKIGKLPAGVWEEHHGYDAMPASGKCILNGDGHDVNFLMMSGAKFDHRPPADLGSAMYWLDRGAARRCIMFFWAGKWQGHLAGRKSPKPLSREFIVHEEDVPLMRGLIAGITVGRTQEFLRQIRR